MAALDFPQSPTLNQQYAAPNGVTYQWDGTAWIVTGGPPGQLWTASGATLVPTDQTKRVVVPGPTAIPTAGGIGQVVAGSRTSKLRLQSLPASTLHDSVTSNCYHDGSAWQRDDTAQPAGRMVFQPNSASTILWSIECISAAGASTTLAMLDFVGKLSVPGPTAAGDQSQVILGTRTTKLHLEALAGLDFHALGANTYYNGSAWAQDDATKPSWFLYIDLGGNGLGVQRAPAGGANATVLSLDSSGNLTIAGATATKASGTTWANPSDPRLKEDIAPYAAGLAEVTQLEPITYRLKAQGPEGPICYGFDAEQVRAVFPECVGTMRTKLTDDGEEEVVLTFDMHPILVALVNAIKELAATRDAA